MTTTREEAQRLYLTRAFQLNPVWRAADIIDLRAKVFKLKRLDQSHAKDDTSDLARLRNAAKSQIARLQSEFWKLPLDDLKRQLEGLNVKKLPELAPVLKRLKTAAACRGEFPRLASETWMDRDLFHAFKKAVVLPPAEAGYQRERFMARISDKKQLKKIQAAVKKIQANYPVIFALESDWFKTLAKHKVRNAGVAIDGGGGEGVGIDLSGLGWPAWLLLFVLIRVILRLLASSN